MISAASKLRTAAALGGANLARVAWYRFGVRTGLNGVRKLRATAPAGPFFGAPATPAPPGLTASAQWGASALWFSRWPVALAAGAPDWHCNVFNGEQVRAPSRPWWAIADFDPAVGDIKLIWEASRFDWVLALAQRAAAGEEGALDKLNAWLGDWSVHNRPYLGVNWKCGQEASIRVMHLAMAALLLGQHGHSAPGLLALVRVHLRRIAPTISYAVAQDNNHGSSEAAALFIGGSWLAAHGDAQGAAWHKLGRRWLENRVARLVAPDGSFSQYSLTYHRMVLDTLSMAELWRRTLGLPAFSARWQARARAATLWLFHFIDPAAGDGPNLGANDGARLLQLCDTDYRDFRPSLQLAGALLAQGRAYAGEGDFNLPLRWLGVALPDTALAAPASRLFDDGGFALLRHGAAMALLRYPRFRFRPSQADALHVDLWLGSDNLLRDAGSYSYNAEPELTAYFAGTASHNTVQFDGRDQMARWGRFLFADWLRTSFLAPLVKRADAWQVGAGYGRAPGLFHRRELALHADRLEVRDQIGGFAGKAVLRWRLAPGPWRIDGNSVSNGRHRLTVTGSAPLARFALVDGLESRYYLEKTILPVLEIEVNVACDLTSTYKWET
ncbi:MAG: heparinase II/III-family protein [Pseudomonadota bacterium]